MSERVKREFDLLTQGHNPEIDALAIMVELFKDFDGADIRRMLCYLFDRYSRP